MRQYAVLLIRTKLIGNNDRTVVVCFSTDVARDTMSSRVTAWLTPNLML